MIKIYIQDDPSAWSTNVYITQELDGKRFIAKPMKIEFEEIKDLEINEPSFTFRRHEGQEFLNEFAQALIGAGFRDKAVSKDGEIKRLQDHLEDLRKISFKFIDKE